LTAVFEKIFPPISRILYCFRSGYHLSRCYITATL